MNPLTIHTVETAPEHSRATLSALGQEIGFVPNMAGAMAESPSLLAGFAALRKAAASSTLSPVEREAVALATGVALGAPYTSAAHGAVLAMVGAEEASIAAIRRGDAPADECLALLTALATAVATGSARVPATAEACFNAGFTPRHVYDVVLVVSMATLVARAHDVAGVAVDAQFGGK